MARVTVADGVAKSIACTLDAARQIVRRKEARTSNTAQAARPRFMAMALCSHSRKAGDTEYDVPVLLPLCPAQPTTLDESPNPV
jgi:hypothetical protein